MADNQRRSVLDKFKPWIASSGIGKKVAGIVGGRDLVGGVWRRSYLRAVSEESDIVLAKLENVGDGGGGLERN